MRASLASFDLPLDPPLVTAREHLNRRRVFLVRLGDSPTGYGDAAPLLPFTEARSETRTALERAVAAIEESGLRRALRIVSETSEGQLRFPAARHAISLAMLDQGAKRSGETLYRRLGGSSPASPVPVNATVGDGPAAETAAAVAAAVEAGFETVKVKVGNRPVAEDIDRMRASREHVGPAVAIRVDANGAWDRSDAGTFLDGVQDLNLEAVEQPLPADQGVAHAELRSSGPAIALDESLRESQLSALLDAEAADRYVLKPTALGGVDVARGAAVRIRRAGATPVLSSIFESVVGRTAAIHLAGAIGDVPACGLATGERFVRDLGPDPAPVVAGEIDPPTGPGLGIEGVSTDG
ncbi:MAG: mandelate racemase/muconate lactonizing enzyme family protein [Halodesulfurarchaeum sp.]